MAGLCCGSTDLNEHPGERSAHFSVWRSRAQRARARTKRRHWWWGAWSQFQFDHAVSGFSAMVDYTPPEPAVLPFDKSCCLNVEHLRALAEGPQIDEEELRRAEVRLSPQQYTAIHEPGLLSWCVGPQINPMTATDNASSPLVVDTTLSLPLECTAECVSVPSQPSNVTILAEKHHNEARESCLTCTACGSRCSCAACSSWPLSGGGDLSDEWSGIMHAAVRSERSSFPGLAFLDWHDAESVVAASRHHCSMLMQRCYELVNTIANDNYV